MAANELRIFLQERFFDTAATDTWPSIMHFIYLVTSLKHLFWTFYWQFLAYTLKCSSYLLQKKWNYLLKEIHVVLLFCTWLSFYSPSPKASPRDESWVWSRTQLLRYLYLCWHILLKAVRCCQFSSWNNCSWNSDMCLLKTDLHDCQIAWKDREVHAHMLRRLHYINMRIINKLYDIPLISSYWRNTTV